jgi:hypothetical protein
MPVQVRLHTSQVACGTANRGRVRIDLLLSTAKTGNVDLIPPSAEGRGARLSIYFRHLADKYISWGLCICMNVCGEGTPLIRTPEPLLWPRVPDQVIQHRLRGIRILAGDRDDRMCLSALLRCTETGAPHASQRL